MQRAVDFEIALAQQAVAAEHTHFIGLIDGPLHGDGLAGVFPTDEEVRVVQFAGPARDGNAFQDQMRIKVHQQAVFESSGFCFIAVDGQVTRLAIFGGQEAPLHAGGEARTTATTQDRILDFINDGRWFHAQALLEGGIAATISIGLARGDGAVFCFAPGVLEGAAAGNVLGQDRFVKKHGGDFQR